jgi:hypothetical protein
MSIPVVYFSFKIQLIKLSFRKTAAILECEYFINRSSSRNLLTFSNSPYNLQPSLASAHCNFALTWPLRSARSTVNSREQAIIQKRRQLNFIVLHIICLSARCCCCEMNRYLGHHQRRALMQVAPLSEHLTLCAQSPVTSRSAVCLLERIMCVCRARSGYTNDSHPRRCVCVMCPTARGGYNPRRH